MCGILGLVSPAITDSARAERIGAPVLQALKPRGPDGAGVSSGAGWLLGHTRLAVLDLSQRANQPMSDDHGAYIVYNGEIYNFKEIREDLRGHGFCFKTSSDTEVLLHALRLWGTDCLKKMRGMFAFAWLDTTQKKMILARDRYGVKPLLYEQKKNEFRFASNLFGLRSFYGCSAEIDPEAAFLYAGLGYVPAPYSILKGIRKVKHGHYMEVDYSGTDIHVREHAYWSVGEIPPADIANGNRSDRFGKFEQLVNEVVSLRLISDVPVGSLLSGGIDSTLVTALCREQPGAQVPSFTMGFDDTESNEAPFARAIAENLGGQHTELHIHERDVLRTWDNLWTIYDEPFADSSAIPMAALCDGVVAKVKVALCGDGGDETHCGYPWHRALDRAGKLLPYRVLLHLLSGPVHRMPLSLARYKWVVATQTDRIGQWIALRTGLSDQSARSLPVEAPAEAISFREYFSALSREIGNVPDDLDWACRMDLLSYLPDDLMVKSDRASMSVGLELREPLLDHQLTAWCLEQPVAARYDRSTGISKLLSRELLQRKVPRQLWERPKQGFTPPLQQWIRGPLRETADDALDRLKRGELLPFILPPHCKDWSDCASKLNDCYGHFFWRVICYSEWLKNHKAFFKARIG